MVEDLKQGISPTPLITVVVITRNRAGILGDCLRNILDQDFPKDQYELVVVDDGSTDQTPSVVKAFQSKSHLPVVNYAPQPHGGVNAARNAGIENARGAAVSFLDDDVLAPADYLKRVWKILSKDPSLAGVGGPMRDYGGSKLRTCRQCSLADVDKPGEGKRISPKLIGGNMVLRTSAFKQVGLFDPAISGRGDESEWFYRAKSLKFFYDPELWVWHRRDNFNLMMLCRHSLVQGLSVPLAQKKKGAPYHPNLGRLIRAAAHVLRRGCAWGIVQTFREIGSIVGYLKLVTTGR